MKEQAIYKFPLLKRILKNLGYQIEKAQPYRAISPVDVSIKDIINGNLEITDDGIFFVSSDGIKYQGFMYKRNYHLDKYGKPRFHIYNCETIQDFQLSGNFHSQYRWANSEIVPVIDMDDMYIDKQMDNLPLCRYCENILLQKQKHTYFDNNDFVKSLKNVISSDKMDVDIFGYVRDWEDISRLYREKMDYTCERCGVHIEDPFDQRYIHCHHKNGDKTNNLDDNLECLCIDCHSKVNPQHMARFSKGANKILLDDFRKKYCE